MAHFTTSVVNEYRADSWVP